MSQMIVNVVGAERGKFPNDDGEMVSFARVYVLEQLKSGERMEALGMRSDTYKADPAAYEAIKTAKLPARFICEADVRQSATGTRVKLLTAEPFGAPVKS